MKETKKDLVIGILVILVGLLSLLINVDILEININNEIITILIFVVGFLFFMGLYLYQGRKEFWPLIPAFVLLGIGTLILVNKIGFNHNVGSGLLMIFIGSGFILIYLLHRENWWALIPGGVVASISLVIFFPGVLGVGLMFIAMGGVFFVLYPVLKKEEGENSWWTLIPGAILSLLGILFLLFDKDYIGKFILPVLLIAGGLYLIFKPESRSKK